MSSACINRLRAGAAHGAVLAALSAMAAGNAAAQDSAAPVELEEIRVEQAGAQRVLGNAEITEEQIEGRNPATLADVFAGESSVQASGGAPIAQKVVVNGIEESLLAVTIDGARQNKSAFHHTGNVLLDPALLKSVEISSGLAPADAGAGAVAGVLAYETKDAQDLLEPGETWGGLVTLGLSTNPAAGRGALTMFGAAGGFEILLSGARHVGDDYEDGDGVRMEGTQPDVTALLGKLAYESEGGSRFELALSDTADTGLRAAQLGGDGRYYARPDFASLASGDNVLLEAKSERRSASFTYTDTAPDGLWDPFVQLAWNSQKIDAIGVKGENTSLSGTAKNDFRLFGGVLTAGVDFFHDTAEGQADNNTGDPKEMLTNIGAFAQMRHDLGDRLSLSWGARLDAQRFELADGRTFEDVGVSVNAAADVALFEGLTATFGLASVWGGHELSEAALINRNGDWAYTDPTPSRALNGRVGLRYETGPWMVSGALFSTNVEDVNWILGPDRAPADLSSQGVEISGAWRGEQGFAKVNYTYADVIYDDAPVGTTGYYLGRPMGHVIGAEAAWDVTPEFRLGGVVQLALENTEAQSDLPGYQAVDLYAEYRPDFAPGLSFRAEVRNAFNETYAKRSSDGLDFSRVVPLNEPGRSFGLTMNLKF